MKSKIDLYLKRANSELDSANILFKISNNNNMKKLFLINEDSTFYSGVISHSYYTIFYCAKAMLLSEDINTKAPHVHKKTIDVFEKIFIKSGILDTRLLIIYKKITEKMP